MKECSLLLSSLGRAKGIGNYSVAPPRVTYNQKNIYFASGMNNCCKAI